MIRSGENYVIADTRSGGGGAGEKASLPFSPKFGISTVRAMSRTRNRERDLEPAGAISDGVRRREPKHRRGHPPRACSGTFTVGPHSPSLGQLTRPPAPYVLKASRRPLPRCPRRSPRRLTATSLCPRRLSRPPTRRQSAPLRARTQAPSASRSRSRSCGAGVHAAEAAPRAAPRPRSRLPGARRAPVPSARGPRRDGRPATRFSPHLGARTVRAGAVVAAAGGPGPLQAVRPNAGRSRPCGAEPS